MSCCNKEELSKEILTPEELREGVRKHYTEIALSSGKNDGSDGGGCSGTGNSCYAPSADPNYAKKLGYSKEDMDGVSIGANLGLGELYIDWKSSPLSALGRSEGCSYARCVSVEFG